MLFQQPVSQLKFITEMANAEAGTTAPFYFKYGEPSEIIV